MSLLINLNYKQTQLMSTIWNGFHLIILNIGDMVHAYMVYLLLVIMTPLEITDETDDLYYDKVTINYEYVNCLNKYINILIIMHNFH